MKAIDNLKLSRRLNSLNLGSQSCGMIDRRVSQPLDDHICSLKVDSINIQQHDINVDVVRICSAAGHFFY
jgi:hypothetical protein